MILVFVVQLVENVEQGNRFHEPFMHDDKDARKVRACLHMTIFILKRRNQNLNT